jgi:hypothetical protein
MRRADRAVGATVLAPGAGRRTVWAIGYSFDLNAYANRTLTILGA